MTGPAPAPYRLLITGSRDWPTPATVHARCDAHLRIAHAAGRGLLVIHGMCMNRHGDLIGADRHADEWARAARRAGLPVRVERHPAEQYGAWPRCGPDRNGVMVARGADACEAFISPCTRPRCPRPGLHGSHGASHCAGLAAQAGIPTLRHYPQRTTR
ncbi:hypothetical protein [Streptomyces sp. URMC 129]|uniref:hypothetical protein n=1 Tax=Streptomyces sp. URMC 129 TaxID=3423407 RepID=UPI003F1CA7C6